AGRKGAVPMTPEQQRALAIARARRRRAEAGAQTPAPQAEPNIVSDVLASGAAGIARGAADLVGLPGTLANALDAGGEWVQRQLGLPTRSEAMAEYGIEAT